MLGFLLGPGGGFACGAGRRVKLGQGAIVLFLRDARGGQRGIQRLDLLSVFLLLGRSTFHQGCAAFHQALICALGLGQAFCRGAGSLGAVCQPCQRLITVLIGGSTQPGGFLTLNRAARGQGVNLLHAFGMLGAHAAFLVERLIQFLKPRLIGTAPSDDGTLAGGIGFRLTSFLCLALQLAAARDEGL